MGVRPEYRLAPSIPSRRHRRRPVRMGLAPHNRSRDRRHRGHRRGPSPRLPDLLGTPEAAEATEQIGKFLRPRRAKQQPRRPAHCHSRRDAATLRPARGGHAQDSPLCSDASLHAAVPRPALRGRMKVKGPATTLGGRFGRPIGRGGASRAADRLLWGRSGRHRRGRCGSGRYLRAGCSPPGCRRSRRR